MTSMASFWCVYSEFWAYFTPCSCVVIADFVNVSTNRVASVNLSKNVCYITYSDIKKSVRLDFIVYKI